MKKIKFLFLTSIAALSLAACGKSTTKDNTLPSGGTTIDITSEKGAIEVKQKLSRSIQETVKGLNSVSITNNLSNTNFTLKAKTTDLAQNPIMGVTMEDIDATLKVKNLKAKAVYQLSGLDKTYADLEGIANLNFGGSVSFEGNLPDTANINLNGTAATVTNKKYSYSLSAKDASILAYYKDNTLYGDFSDDNLYSFVKSLDEVVNKVTTDFSVQDANYNILDLFNGLLGENKKISYDLTSYIGDKANEKILPEIDEDTVSSLEESIKEYLDNLVEVENMTGVKPLTFQKYDDERFGISLSLTKDDFITLELLTYATWDEDGSTSTSSIDYASSIKKQLSDSIKKFNVKAAILFDENGLLSKIGESYDISVNSNVPLSLYNGVINTNVDVTYELSSGFSTEIAYNQSVQLPNDFSDFTPIKFE